MSKKLLLFVLSLVANLFFLYFYNPNYYYTISQLHGQIGYNLNKYNSIKLNPQFSDFMQNELNQQGRLIDFDDARLQKFGIPNAPFPVNDTVGYGILLGLLWKLTGSFRFIDVQILQILIFSLLMLLVYQIFLHLFASPSLAWWSCMAFLFFFPIIAMNVQPVRDIWAFYGVVLLLYGLLAWIHQKSSWTILALCSIGFAVCQCIRPSVFLAFITISCVTFSYSLFQEDIFKRSTQAILMFAGINILFFWLPFMAYNKMNYNRYFVGPVGQDLVEGLGEFENPWGFQLSDHWISAYIEEKYNLKCGTPEFDDKAKEEFNAACKQQPLLFFTNMLKRIPGLILPGLPWIYYKDSPYDGCTSLIQKLKKACSSISLFLDFLLRHVYIRLYLILGYVGIFMVWRQRLYWPLALLIFGVLCGGFGKLPSHIEYRYIVPFYWIFSFFVGFALFEIYKASKTTKLYAIFAARFNWLQ